MAGLGGGVSVAGQGECLSGGLRGLDGHLRQRFHAVVEGGGCIGGAGTLRQVLRWLMGDRQLAYRCSLAAALRG